jgi:hypothetical protein
VVFDVGSQELQATSTETLISYRWWKDHRNRLAEDLVSREPNRNQVGDLLDKNREVNSLEGRPQRVSIQGNSPTKMPVRHLDVFGYTKLIRQRMVEDIAHLLRLPNLPIKIRNSPLFQQEGYFLFARI